VRYSIGELQDYLMLDALVLLTHMVCVVKYGILMFLILNQTKSLINVIRKKYIFLHWCDKKLKQRELTCYLCNNVSVWA